MGKINRLGLKNLAENTALTLGRKLLGGLLGFITVVIVARFLGPGGNGRYAVAMLLPNVLASFLSLGIAPANIYYLGTGKFSVSTVLRTTITLTAIISLVGLCLGSMGIVFFGDQWFPGVPPKVLWLALIIFPFSLFQSFLSSILQGLQKFHIFNLSLMVLPVVRLVLVVLLALVNRIDLEFVISAFLIATICGVIALWLAVSKCIDHGGEHSSGLATPAYLRQALNYGFKAHLGNILSFVNYKADIFLVNLLINPASAGLYAVSVSIVERLWLLSHSANTVLFPRLSQLDSNEENRRQITPILCRSVIMLTALAAAILACFAFPLVEMFFGSAYLPVIPALLILLPGIVAGAGARIIANDIAARGRPEINMYLSIVVVLINIIGNLSLIPEYGIEGAALATTGAYVFNLILRLVIYNQLSSNRYLDSLLITADDIARFKSWRKRRDPGN